MPRTLLPLLALVLGCVPRATPEVAPHATAEAIPFDPDVRHGVLDNGIRWFVETNDKPDDRAVLRLVVEAGSVLEDEDQLGLAHFVEHMAFNGTTHFAGNELIRYLEKVGTRFGAHLNAHTSFEETVYKLQVPTDDPSVFDQAFVILEDWAHGLKFDPAEVDKERGVVLEEWRRGLGPWQRAREATMPVSWAGSPYPERLPIGTEESLETFTHDAAVRFYRDWYRPDLMSVIVVGDVDPDAVQAKIEAHFGGISAPRDPRPRVRPDVPDRAEPAHVVFSDPEITRTSLSLEAGADWRHEGTYAAYREGFVHGAFFFVMNERLADLARDPDGPFLGAGASRGRRTPVDGVWSLAAQPREGRVLEAYERLLIELARMRQHGPTEAELDRAKAATLRNVERYYNERDTTESVTHAEELIRHVTTAETVPGIAAEWALAQRYVPTLTTAEIQSFARDTFLPDAARVTTVVMPRKEGLTEPTPDALRAVEDRVRTLTIEPPTAESVDAPLVSVLPTPGTVTAARQDETGFTVWTLSNGAEVWVMPTDFESEQILFRGRSVGGHNAVPDEGYVAAATADDIVAASGLGALDASALAKRLTGHSVGVRPWIGGTHEGVSGSSTPQDLELLMQLTWLTFTAPRFDPDGFEVVRRRQAESLRNRLADPRTPYQDAYTRLVWQDFPRWRPWTEETLGQMDLARSQAFYADRFGDASDFRFVFVGNVDLETLKPLVAQYLAALPSQARVEARTDLGARRVSGAHEETIRTGSDPKAEVAILLHGRFDSTFATRNRLEALQEVLATRLREVLREEKGGVYGVSASAQSAVFPEESWTVEISFVCDPDRVSELEAAALGVLEEVRSAPVDDRLIEAWRQKSLRSRQEALRTNGFWASMADETADVLALTGESLTEVLTYDARVNALTAEALHEMATALLATPDQAVVRRIPLGDDAR